jgi:hypothetical protein
MARRARRYQALIRAIDLTQALAPPPRHWPDATRLTRHAGARKRGERASLTVRPRWRCLPPAAGSVVGGAAALAGGRADQS